MSKKTKKESTNLESAIDELITRMRNEDDESSDDYAKMADQLVKLHKLKQDEAPGRLDNNTKLVVAGNVLVALIIVGHERSHVITTRALQFMQKLR